MAPSFLNFKELRRRSKASFRTERSTDESSEASNNTTPTSGSLTPPSIGALSDPALDLQLKEQLRPSLPTAIPRPQPNPYPNGASNRYSVSGMVGLGSPVPGGRGPSLPVSQYSPQITNVADNSWVSDTPGSSGLKGRFLPQGSWASIVLGVVCSQAAGLPKSASCQWHDRRPVPVSRRHSHCEPTRRQLSPYLMAGTRFSL